MEVMENRSYEYRRHKRYIKGIKRVRKDRAQHGNDHSCECFCPDIDKGKGAVFGRLADTPKDCQHWMCSNAAWGRWEDTHYVPEE
jgi:hypothetical protein